MTEPVTPESAPAADDIAVKLGLGKERPLFFRLKPYLLWGAVALLVLVTGSIALNRRSAGNQIKYRTEEITRGTLTVTVSATGTLQPTNQVEVGSEISGILKSVEVDYNDRITRGQVLARIDTDKLEAQSRQVAASLAAAKARVLQAVATAGESKSRLARLLQVQEASGGKVPSKSDIDTARAAVERAIADEANARAVVSQAEATLDGQRIDLSKAVIRSPINGVVLKRAAEPGQTVAAAFQTPVLFSLAEDLKEMELHVDVDEADVGKVRKAQEASFTVAAYPDRSFPARIKQVRFGSKTVAGVVTYETVLTLDNSQLLLRPGMTGTASITVQKVDNALLVPNAALRFTPPAAPAGQPDSGGSLLSKMFPRPPAPAAKPVESAREKQRHLWQLRDGTLQRYEVTTGVTDGVRTEIRGGKVDQGMAVVIEEIEAKK